MGGRVFTGNINKRHWYHAYCGWWCYTQHQRTVNPSPSKKNEKLNEKEQSLLPKMLIVKPLPAIICYRPELCINRNSFYEESYPPWDMSHCWILVVNERDRQQWRESLPGWKNCIHLLIKPCLGRNQHEFGSNICEHQGIMTSANVCVDVKTCNSGK